MAYTLVHGWNFCLCVCAHAYKYKDKAWDLKWIHRFKVDTCRVYIVLFLCTELKIQTNIISLRHSAEIAALFQHAGVKGKRLLQMFPQYSRTSVYRHATYTKPHETDTKPTRNPGNCLMCSPTFTGNHR